MENQEESLIRKAQRGNIKAFEELVRCYDKKVMKIILNMINNVEDARDIYQEVFIKVFQSITKFQYQSKFYTWLFRIAVNTSINFRKKRASQLHDSIDSYFAEAGGSYLLSTINNTKNPEQRLLNLELSKKIQQSIDQLPPKQRAVFILRHYNGYKLTEIAEILNYSEGTVKNYIFRSVQKLKRLLKEYQQI